MEEGRVKKSSRNMIFSVIAFALQIVLGFIVRRYFIFYFSSEYLGLNSLFSNVISLLSLAELGFGTAIVFAMYKPMAEKDEERVRELLQFYKKCYSIIGTVILAIGLCVLPFMDYFKAQAPTVELNFYIIYLIFLFNAVISYFFAHRKSLIYTDQRNDIETKVTICLNLLSVILQLISIIIFKNYYLYILVAGIINILNNLIIYIITQKKYKNYLQKPKSYIDKATVKEINKNIRAMILHKIGSAIVYSTDNLIIYFLIGSAVLGKYSNYVLITTYVSTLIDIIINGIRGSIGNSIASETREKNQKLFRNLNFIFMWIVSFSAVCIFVLADPFIDVVLIKGQNTTLFLDNVLILLITANFFFSTSRHMCSLFKECAGIFHQDRFKPIFESLVNLVVSIVLANYIGLAGVIIGTIASNIFVSLWVEPYVLNKHYLKDSTIKYFITYFMFIIATLISGYATVFISGFVPNGSLIMLVLKFVVCAIIPNIMLLLCLGWTPVFKESFKFGIDMVKKLFKRNKIEKHN